MPSGAAAPQAAEGGWLPVTLGANVGVNTNDARKHVGDALMKGPC